MSVHELSSIMLYIHPPLAIVAYVFIFLFAILQLKNIKNQKISRYVCLIGWVL